MKQNILILLNLFLFYSCGSEGINSLIQNEENGAISIALDKANAPKDVVEVMATLSRANFDDIKKSMNIFDDTNANILFNEIVIGKWTLSIEAFNAENIVVYSGETEVNVTQGNITPISLQLNPTTGSIFVNVTWGTSIFNNIITFYPFSGNTYDNSGNEINAINYGAKLTEDRFGHSNNAYFFDGINDFINVKHDNKLNIEDDLTICVWIKPESFEGISNAILNYQADNTDNPETNNLFGILFRNGNNKLSYVHESGNGINHFHTFENFNFVCSLWYHIVIVRKTNKKIVELYINGEKNDEIEYSENPANGTLSFLRIGEFQGTVENDRFFHGAIDDIVILNRSISADEIKYFYTISK